MRFISKQVMDKAYQAGDVKQISELEYEYTSKYRHIEMRFKVGELLKEFPSSLKNPDNVHSFVEYSIELLEFYSFYRRLEGQLDEYPDQKQQLFDVDIDQAGEVLKPNSTLSAEQVSQLASEYKAFLAGERKWKHTTEAKKYGVSTSSIRRYLQNLGIYEPTKHRKVDK